MITIIFAGGTGTRLWPLSRRKSPKQFEKVVGDKSTLQLSVDRLLPEFKWKDIYVATSVDYVPIIGRQLPQIPNGNIIGEPISKDVGPSVGLMMAVLYKRNPKEPIIIQWSDHLIREDTLFKKIIKVSSKIIRENGNKIIFISQKPRFASQNLGWIEYGKTVKTLEGSNFYAFEGFKYRPSLEVANQYLKSGKFAWNVGYFVTTPSFLWKQFEIFQPEMFQIMREIYKTVDKPNFSRVVKKLYTKFPKISFDNAILEHIKKEDAFVVTEDLGWSDVGAWEALKEALQTSPDQNVIKGKVLLTDCRDSLVYNYTNQMVVTIDIEGFLVVNTQDVILICHKNSVPKIKKLVENLAETENGHLI